MSHKRVTMKDIATQLGVSKAAVSYALNGQPGVGEETRAEVLRLAKQLGWEPSATARALSGGSTDVIGIVLSRPPKLLTLESFFLRFFAGAERTLASEGLSTLLRVSDGDLKAEVQTYATWWAEGRVDGVLLIDERFEDPRISAVQHIGCPAVIAGEPVNSDAIPCVWTNQEVDASKIIAHLFERGHRSIAHIAGPREFVHERRRAQSTRTACDALDMRIVTRHCSYLGDDTEAALEGLMALPTPPSAVIFGSEYLALRGISWAARRRIRVPTQLALVSWEDSPAMEFAAIPITALSRDNAAFGELTARVLVDLIRGKNRGAVAAPSAPLTIRESTPYR